MYKLITWTQQFIENRVFVAVFIRYLLQFKHPKSYVSGYVSITDWERDTESFENDYQPKDQVVAISHSFTASNAFGVAGSENYINARACIVNGS